MVGSSASASALFLVSSLAVSFLLSSLLTSSGGGGGGGGATGFSTGRAGLSTGRGFSGGATGSGGGGGGGGGGSDAIGPGGREPGAPGMNEKSSESDDESEGTCSPRDARVTPVRVLLRASSALRSGTRISLSNSCTNRLWSLPLSPTTEPGVAEYITSVPFGAITGARPAE